MPKKRKPAASSEFDALLAKAPNTILLNIQEDMQRLTFSYTELSTGMRFLVQANEEARASRNQIHEKLNDLREGHADTRARVGHLENVTNRLRSDVDRHEVVYQQDLGGQKLVAKVTGWFSSAKMVIASIVGVGGYVGWHLWPSNWWPK